MTDKLDDSWNANNGVINGFPVGPRLVESPVEPLLNSEAFDIDAYTVGGRNLLTGPPAVNSTRCRNQSRPEPIPQGKQHSIQVNY